VFFATIQNLILGKNLFTRDFPKEKKHTLLWRMITGQVGFFFFNYCLTLIPLTFVIIIVQTSGFWTSIMARCFFKEPLICLELVGMVICFAAVVTITLSGANSSNKSEEEVS